jgi:hypothetical protein
MPAFSSKEPLFTKQTSGSAAPGMTMNEASFDVTLKSARYAAHPTGYGCEFWTVAVHGLHNETVKSFVWTKPRSIKNTSSTFATND